MKTIGYLILHYKVINETINLIESIEKRASRNDELDYQIIVVDNGSVNGTGESLQEKYKEKSYIHVILSKENLGFARGNNLGFVYAKKELGCDFICMMNNDTELLQDDFFEKILDEYSNSGAAVIGPKIILNDSFQPIYKREISVEKVESDIKYMKKQILYCRLHIQQPLIKFFRFMNKVTGKKRADSKNVDERYSVEKRHEGIVLHGCCLIFTPKYIKLFDGLNDATFLYREEEFLYLRLKEHNLLSVYNPEITIRHFEDAATNSICDKPDKKQIFQYTNDIESSKKLIEEINRVNSKK